MPDVLSYADTEPQRDAPKHIPLFAGDLSRIAGATFLSGRANSHGTYTALLGVSAENV